MFYTKIALKPRQNSKGNNRENTEIVLASDIHFIAVFTNGPTLAL